MRGFTMIIAATWLTASLVAAETGFLDRTVKVGAETYRYQVFIPSEWVPTQRWPIILELN